VSENIDHQFIVWDSDVTLIEILAIKMF